MFERLVVWGGDGDDDRRPPPTPGVHLAIGLARLLSEPRLGPKKPDLGPSRAMRLATAMAFSILSQDAFYNTCQATGANPHADTLGARNLGALYLPPRFSPMWACEYQGDRETVVEAHRTHAPH